MVTAGLFSFSVFSLSFPVSHISLPLSSAGFVVTAFSSINEIREEVVKKANNLYGEYVEEGLKQNPAFKGFGMKYIEFAKDEPELFKLLFMTDENKIFSGNFLPNYDMYSPKVLCVLENTYMMTEEAARRLYNHMSVYAFGFAALYAQGITIFSMDEISRMISEVFAAMVKNDDCIDIEYLKKLL